MMPLIVRHHAAGGQMRTAACVPDKEAEGMAAAAAIQVELFPAAAIALGN